MSKERPKIGVGVIVRNKNKVLVGKRNNSHGEGYWAFPGGHLECGETIEGCAEREVMEETGITVKNTKKVGFTNDIFDEEDKHYVTLFVMAEYDGGEVQNLEPHKCEEWKWVEWKSLPEPLFLPIKNLQKENITLFE